MEELVKKLTSYNIFNYLLPGALFAVLGEKITAYKFVQSDVITALFLYYFIGLVVSRIGSLCVEPVMKWTTFVTFAPYSDFVTASSKDTKLDSLSEQNNTYRSLCALFLVLGGLKLYELAINHWQLPASAALGIVLLALFLLFAGSYRKQTKYITQRIQVRKDELS